MNSRKTSNNIGDLVVGHTANHFGVKLLDNGNHIDVGVLFTKNFRRKLSDPQILNNILVISEVLDDENSWFKIYENIQLT